MRLFILILGVIFALVGCAQAPKPTAYPLTFQKKMQAASHWDLLAEDVADQIAVGDKRIVGIMLESHLVAGRQDVEGDRDALTYGQSITDACISWDQTAPVMYELAEAVRQRREKKAG